MTAESRTILSVKSLKAYLYEKSRRTFNRVIQDATFDVKMGQITGLVGESGSGKTLTACSILGILPHTPGIVGGKIIFRNKDGSQDMLEGISDDRICKINQNGNSLVIHKDLSAWNRLYNYEGRMKKLRGREICIIMQGAKSSLNPYMTVMDQIVEGSEIGNHGNCDSDSVNKLMLELNLGPHANKFSNELSGGTCFRVMIGMALAASPGLLIADEPTTGIDPPLQVKIVELFEKYKSSINSDTQHSPAMLLITHQMHLVRRLADWIVVMYGGNVVERVRSQDLYSDNCHPYTAMLLRSARVKNLCNRQNAIGTIGQKTDTSKDQKGCIFQHHCPLVDKTCREEIPIWTELSESHFIRCHHHDKL